MQFVPNVFHQYTLWNHVNVVPRVSPVSKLIISPIIPSIKVSDVIQYFEQFGEAECWDLRRAQHFDVCIVQFKYPKSVYVVLQKRYHRVQKYIITVEAADQFDTRTYSANPSNLLELNDEHLLKIFNNLNVYDLCAMARACARLKQVAKWNFSTRFDKITWRANDPKAKMMFETFGELITSLDVDVIEPQNDFIELVVNVCDKRLQNLCLWMDGGGILEFETKLKLKLLFSRLLRLDIYCREFFDLHTTKELLSSCYQLESISLNCTTGMSFTWNYLNIRFPKLNELMFHFNQAINDNGLNTLLNYNPGIRKLHLDECTGLSLHAIDIIVRCLPNLEAISLGSLPQNIGTSNLLALANLRQLKSVTIILGPALPLINVICGTGLPLEKLVLWYADVNDEVIERISEIKTIKSLEFYSNTHVTSYIMDYHLDFLSQKLFRLNELRLIHSEHVTINGLKKILINARHLTHLGLSNMKNITTADKQDLLHFANQFVNRTNLKIDLDFFNEIV